LGGGAIAETQIICGIFLAHHTQLFPPVSAPTNHEIIPQTTLLRLPNSILSITQRCPNEGISAVEVVVEVEAEETPATEAAEEEAGVAHTDRNNKRNPKRRTFSISPNTWISKCLSSLTAAGKVGR
jgi:hypothetical protein